MDDGIPLGKVVGFPLSIDWSVLVIMWLFTWSLAATLPDTAPGHSSSAYWLAGACGAAVLLASLLAHELTHAIVARHRGVEVLGVKLWLFGGIAGLGGEAKTPGRNQLIPEVFQARRPLIRRYRPPPVGCPLRWSLWLLSGPHGPREAPTGRTYWRVRSRGGGVGPLPSADGHFANNVRSSKVNRPRKVGLWPLRSAMRCQQPSKPSDRSCPSAFKESPCRPSHSIWAVGCGAWSCAIPWCAPATALRQRRYSSGWRRRSWSCPSQAPSVQRSTTIASMRSPLNG